MDRQAWRDSGDWLGRIETLERRLDHYHEELEDALEHDRQFQLKASWGIANVLVGLGAVAALGWLVSTLDLSDGMRGTLFGVGMLVAFVIGYVWSDKGREQDAKKLAHLPRWEDH